MKRLLLVMGFLCIALANTNTMADSLVVSPATSSFGPNGPDGIAGTLDDPVVLPGEVFFLGVFSGYAGDFTRPPGRYPGEAGGPVTIASTLQTDIVALGSNLYRYTWTLRNTGSADMIAYFDTNGAALPNFITSVNNFGNTELDGSAGPPVDLSVAPTFEVQAIVGGPPIPLAWGGAWNPTSGTEADSRQPSPIPEPCSGLLSVLAFPFLLRRCRQ